MSDELAIGETHPCAHDAFAYVKLKLVSSPMLLESLSSCALSGNRTAEICLGTVNRILKGAPVSDRYVLGLAWFLLELEKEGRDE